MKTATAYYKDSYSGNLTAALSSLVKKGRFNEVARDTYALDSRDTQVEPIASAEGCQGSGCPKWKAAKTVDDLATMKEAEFLSVLEALSIIGKSVKQELDRCLRLRNGCGHPNSRSNHVQLARTVGLDRRARPLLYLGT